MWHPATALQGAPDQGCSNRADCAKPQGHTGKCVKTKRSRAKTVPAADSKDSAEPSALPLTSQEAGSMLGGPEHAPGHSGRGRVRRGAALKIKSLAEVDASTAETGQDSDDIPLADCIEAKAAEAVDSEAQPKPTAKRANQAKSTQTAKRPNQAQPQSPAKKAKKSPKESDSESYSPYAEEQAAEPAKKKARTSLEPLLPTNTCMHCSSMSARQGLQGCVWHACRAVL